MPPKTNLVLTSATELKCWNCERTNVRPLKEQDYFICNDCGHLLWEIERRCATVVLVEKAA